MLGKGSKKEAIFIVFDYEGGGRGSAKMQKDYIAFFISYTFFGVFRNDSGPQNML